MKYFIVDNEIGIVKTLENIVESNGLGEVIGFETDPIEGEKQISALNPDIVLVDLLMDKIDGISLVRRVKATRPNISMIMISQVNDKDMVSEAYNAGIEFFISKPINIIEVKKVLKNVNEARQMKNIMEDIKGIAFGNETAKKPVDSIKDIKSMLRILGMLGEKGTLDILNLCRWLLENQMEYDGKALKEFSSKENESPKSLEQRMRRAVKKGLTNVASLGIEDTNSDLFQNYVGYVFDFAIIKEEMDFLRGNSPYGGRANLTKFINGLLMFEELE